MKVRMLVQRTLQDAGVERPLNVGVVYELAPVVAQSLIATGAAERVEAAAVLTAPETKPTAPPENKRRLV